MFCGKCGKEIKEGTKFCNNCGAPVSTKGQSNVTQKILHNTKEVISEVITNRENIKRKVKNNKKIVIIIIAILLVIVVGHSRQNNQNDNKNISTSKTNSSNVSSTSTKSTKTNSSTFSPDDVVVGTTIKSWTGENKSNDFVTMILWDRYKNLYPNAKCERFEIKEADGYGRFWIYMKYMKNTSDTTYSQVHEIVWWVDDTHYGVYLTTDTDIYSKKAQAKWGTKINISD